MNFAILIPARFQSSRYPGKPLVALRGVSGVAKPLIQRSREAALRVAGVVCVHVVTDDRDPPFALRELNNPEDVEAIEAALAAAGLE